LYEITLTRFSTSELGIFDENLTEINYHPLWKNSHAFRNNNCFIIESSGLYYVKVTNPILDEYTMAINKITYETMADVNEPLLIFDTNEVICEGKFDFAYYYFETTGDGVLKIDPSEASPLVFCKGLFSEFCEIEGDRAEIIMFPSWLEERKLLSVR